MKKILCLFALLLFFQLDGYSKTKVGGGIYSNTIWTAANSPYIVTSNLTLFPSDTLWIEPGVVVKFDKGIWLEVRGALILMSNKQDSIIFTTGFSNPHLGVGGGITINQTLGGSINKDIEYVSFNYCSSGINIWGSFVYPLNFKRCTFFNCVYGLNLGGYSYSLYTIDSCNFFSNEVGVEVSSFNKISNSVFVNNNIGLRTIADTIYKNEFYCNQVAVSASFIKLKDNIIMYNGVGLNNNYTNPMLNATGNVITQNDTGIIVYTSHFFHPSNKVCNNRYYNLRNASNLNVTISNVCWCESNSMLIAEKICDGYDQSNLGLVDFSTFAICNDTIPFPKKHCPKEPEEPPITNSYTVSPNPFVKEAIVRFSYSHLPRWFDVRIYNTLGQLVFSAINKRINTTDDVIIINGTDLSAGIYFFKIMEGNNVLGIEKLIVE